MARRKESLRIDSKALNKVLQKTAPPQLERAAKLVQSKLPPEYSVGVEMGTDRNGRPRALIAIMHPKGLSLQAEHGLLTRAAAEAGLDVHRYPIRGG